MRIVDIVLLFWLIPFLLCFLLEIWFVRYKEGVELESWREHHVGFLIVSAFPVFNTIALLWISFESFKFFVLPILIKTRGKRD